MNYILIIIFISHMGGAGVGMTSVEITSKWECEMAAAEIIKRNKGDAFCIGGYRTKVKNWKELLLKEMDKEEAKR